MTSKELSNLYYLSREIALDKERLEELRADAAAPASPSLSGMPNGTRTESALEKKSEKIFELEKIIEQKIRQATDEKIRIETYIATVPDSLIRMILTCRFVRLMSWQQIAFKVGGYNTADSVRMMCVRFLEKGKENDSGSQKT